MKKMVLIGMLLVEAVMLFSQEVQLRSYIGKWKVDRIFTVNEDYHVIGDLIKNEAYAYMGVIIEYDREGIVLDGEKFINTRKIQENFFKDEQLKYYTRGSWYPGYTFKDLGITEKIIKEIFVHAKNNRGISIFGAVFYQINDNELIIKYRGWFYHAVRIK
jgi:hypothetical protein